jgi:preprotein translocase subunit YajC
MMAAMEVAALLLGAAAKKSSGSPVLLIFVVIGAGFYFLIYRPQQRKAKALREQSKGFDVGDEVLTAGGIVGHIIDIDGDRVTMETSVGASFVVLKQYVLRTLEEPASELDEDDTDGDDVADDFEDHDDQAAASADDPTDDDESGADETSHTGDHPSGQGGTTGRSTKAEGGDDPGGPEGPPVI